MRRENNKHINWIKNIFNVLSMLTCSRIFLESSFIFLCCWFLHSFLWFSTIRLISFHAFTIIKHCRPSSKSQNLFIFNLFLSFARNYISNWNDKNLKEKRVSRKSYFCFIYQWLSPCIIKRNERYDLTTTYDHDPRTWTSSFLRKRSENDSTRDDRIRRLESPGDF